MAKGLFDIGHLGAIVFDTAETLGVDQRQFTQPLSFCQDNKLRHSHFEAAPLVLSQAVLNSTNRLCVSILFIADRLLVNGGFMRFKTTRIMYNQYIDGGIDALDIQEAYLTKIDANCAEHTQLAFF